MKVVIDLETASTVNLKTEGLVRYTASDSTLITVMAFQILDEGSKIYTLVHPQYQAKENSQEALDAFNRVLDNDVKFIAHNAKFERDLLNTCGAKFLENVGITRTLKKLSIKDFIDTQVLANIFRSPPALKAACKFFRLPALKDEVGHKIMKAVCMLRKDEPKRLTTVAQGIPVTWTRIAGCWAKVGPEVYKAMADYCAQDVKATSTLYKYLTSKKMIAELGDIAGEMAYGARATDEMNERGVLIDMEWIDILSKHAEAIYNHLDDISMKYFKVPNAQQKAKILAYLKSQKYKIENLGKADIVQAIKDNPKHEELNEGLRLYAKYNKSSLRKIAKIKDTVSSDNRLRDMFRYCGAAATGRWSSYGVQLQNLPRTDDKTKPHHIVEFMEEGGCPIENPVRCQDAIRALLVPKKGCKFFVADLKQIEMRVAMYSGGYGQEIKEMSEGRDIYQEMADAIGIGIRQVGKEIMLAAQYGQGPKSFLERLELGFGLEIGEKEAAKHIQTYRRKYKGIAQLWNVEDKNIHKARINGTPFKIKLRSGRYLNYGKLTRRLYKGPDGKKRRSVDYFNGTFYKALWGGSVFQHKAQAEARDILMFKFNALARAGYEIVGTVHDEVIIEVPENDKLEKWESIWDAAGAELIEEKFPGLVLDSDCKFMLRFGK